MLGNVRLAARCPGLSQVRRGDPRASPVAAAMLKQLHRCSRHDHVRPRKTRKLCSRQVRAHGPLRVPRRPRQVPVAATGDDGTKPSEKKGQDK